MAQMQATINAKQLEVGAVQTDEVPTENSGNHMTSGDIYQTLKNSTKGFVDVEPTAGSDNLVKSGGVAMELLTINDDINGTRYKDGYYINSSGVEVSSPYYGVSDFIPVLAGHQYNWKSKATNFDNDAKLCIYNISKVQVNYYSDYGADGTTFNITDNGYVRLSYGLGTEKATLFDITDNKEVWIREDGIKNRLEDVEDVSETNKENILNLSNLPFAVNGGRYKDGYYLNSLGEEIADNLWGVSDFIPVKSGHLYTYNMRYVVYNANAKVCSYNADKVLVDSGSGGPMTGSAYLRISYGLGVEEATIYDSTDNIEIWRRANSLRSDIDNVNERTTKIEGTLTYQILPSTILTAIENERQRVSKEAPTNLFSFGWITDVHLGGTIPSLNRLYTLAKYGKSSSIKSIVFGGDIVSGQPTVASDMKLMQNGKEALSDNFALDTFIVRGNHDGGHYSWKAVVDGGGIPTEADIVSNKDWYNMMVSRLNGIIKDSDNPMGGYFYKDYEFEKVRMVILNPYDWDGSDEDGVYNAMYGRACITQPQIEWLINKALNFTDKGSDKSNWRVFVFSHDGFILDDDYLDDGYQIDCILNAFNTGTSYSGYYSRESKPAVPAFTFTADFTSQGAIRCSAVFYGHTHRDRVIFNFGIPHISTAAAHPDDTEDMPIGSTLPLPRVIGEVSEYCWDTVILGKYDYLYLYRFGAKESGKSRGDRIIYPDVYTVRIGETVELNNMLAGSWSIYSVSRGYYVPIVGGVEGTPVGTPTVTATINNGVVTGVAVGEATACVQSGDGTKEFFSIVVIE